MKVLGLILGFSALHVQAVDRKTQAEFPIATLHGMGDSCFNGGMMQFTEKIANFMGVTTKCIPLGDTQDEDVSSAFSLLMNEQVDEFARRVKDDPDFENGFRLAGISQGALIARGYIQRYSWREDYPTADSLLSIHGPLMGVGKLPLCSPNDGQIGEFCTLLNSLTGDAAYRAPIQNNLAQANYYRHPCYIEDYLGTKFLPPLNGETDNFYPESGDVRGLDSLSSLIAVKADRESIVVPPESSWFGIYADGSCNFEDVLTMQETNYFQNDSFGLKTLLDSGRLFFERTSGGHASISTADLNTLLEKYWK